MPSLRSSQEEVGDDYYEDPDVESTEIDYDETPPGSQESQ
jgi:hypothetical protein